MTIICNKCNKELDRPGALLFSPPYGKIVYKYHICIECYYLYFSFIIKNAFEEDNIIK